MTDYTKICRICLATETEATGKLRPIKTARIHLNTISLVEVMSMLTIDNLVEDERFPQNICSVCIKDITAGYVFKLKCEQAEIYLKKEILNIHPNYHRKRSFKTNASTSTDDLLATQQSMIELVALEESEPNNRSFQSSEAQNANVPAQCQNSDGENQALRYEVVHDQFSGDPVFSINLNPPYGQTLDTKYAVAYDPAQSNYLYTNADGTQYPNVAINLGNNTIISKFEEVQTVEMDEFNEIIETEEYAIMKSEDHDIIAAAMEYEENHAADGQQASSIKKATQQKAVVRKRKRAAKKPVVKTPGAKRTRKVVSRTPFVSKTLECAACSQVFQTSRELRPHYYESHTQGNFCYLCQKSVKCINNHFSIHYRLEPIFECKLCPEKFVSDYKLNQHMNTYHPSFKCMICSMELNNEAEYEAHLIAHEMRPPDANAASSQEYQLRRCCETCKLILNGPIELRSHFETEHMDGQFCKVCDQGIPASKYKRHVNDHVRLKIFDCDQCRKRFTCQLGLMVHQSVSHDLAKVCQYCMMHFDRREDYEQHQRNHEADDTNNIYKCHICERQTQGCTALMTHFGIHIERPYKCDDCWHTFHHESDLLKHLALEHKVKCSAGCNHCRLKIN